MRGGIAVLSFAMVCAYPLAASGQGITNLDIRAAAEAAPEASWDQTWGVASHVLSSTPAVEASMLEAGPTGEPPRESVLVIKTIPGPSLPDGIYLHDYRRCSSIHLSSLVSVSPASIGSGEFLLLETEKSNIREYAVYFIVHDLGTQWTIDSKYLADEYTAQGASAVYNVQLWSSDPQETLNAVSRFLAELATQRPMSYVNTSPIAPPPVFASWTSLSGAEVAMRLRSDSGISNLDITAVAWTAPNPTPASLVTNLATVRESEIVIIDLSSIAANPSDVEVQFHTGGQKVDQVFTSFNAFGDGASNWLPFSSSDGSAASLAPTTPPTTSPPIPDGEARLSASTIRVNANLAGASSFLGVFTEILPELSERPDFRDYEGLRLWLRSSHGGLRSVEVKLEFETGQSASRVVVPGSSWSLYSLPFSSFSMAGSSLDWLAWGDRLERVTLAAVDVPGQPRDFTVDVSTLGFERTPPVACNDGVDNDGDGAVDLADSGCASVSDRSEFNSSIACDDGADNDADGAVDFPADEDCIDSLGESEGLPASVPAVGVLGLGVLALGLASASRLVRRGRRS